jgi:ankyrin repeat protein
MVAMRLALSLALLFSPLVLLAQQDDLFSAVRAKDVTRMQQALKAGADVNGRNENGETPLHLAVGDEAPAVVEALLEAGAIPILTDWRGVGPLAIARDKKNDRLVTTLTAALGTSAAATLCEISRLQSDSAEGVQQRFLVGHPVRVREALLDALQAMGFVPSQDKLPKDLATLTHLELKRSNPKIAGTGGGYGDERAVIDLVDATDGGTSGVRVSMDTKKNLWGGRLRQHSWSVPVLNETECLLDLLGNQPLVTASAAPAASAPPATLADGAVVKLRLYHFVHSGQVREGSEMRFVVIEDVAADNGAVAVRRGAVGNGRITGLTERSSYYRDARFRFQVESVQAVDGNRVQLRNSEQGAGRRQGPAGVVQAPLIGLWLKGEEKGIRAGMVVVGYVEGVHQVRAVQP